MRRLIWELRRLRAQLGWPLLAGLLCIAAAAVLHRSHLLDESTRVESLKQEIASLQAELTAREGLPVAVTAEQRLAGLYQSFPRSTATEHTAVLAKLQSAAAAEGLLLEQASYRLTLMSSDTLPSLHIEVPLKGGYGPLRRFVVRVLHDTPTLSLEGFTLNRVNVAEAAVEAQMVFVLYMQGPRESDLSSATDVSRTRKAEAGS